jgi:hypothetical protein
MKRLNREGKGGKGNARKRKEKNCKIKMDLLPMRKPKRMITKMGKATKVQRKVNHRQLRITPTNVATVVGAGVQKTKTLQTRLMIKRKKKILRGKVNQIAKVRAEVEEGRVTLVAIFRIRRKIMMKMIKETMNSIKTMRAK